MSNQINKVLVAVTALICINCSKQAPMDEVKVQQQSATGGMITSGDGTGGFVGGQTTGGLFSGWPDVIECKTQSGMFVVLRAWNMGAAGNVSYGGPESYVTFSPQKKIIDIVGPRYAALIGSSCQIGSSIAGLPAREFTVADQPMFDNLPDAIVCQTSGSAQMILHRWARGAAGNTAYGTATVNVAVNSSGSIVYIEGKNLFASLRDSNCTIGAKVSATPGASSIKSTNIALAGTSGIETGLADVILCASPTGMYNVLPLWIKGIEGNIAYGFPGTEVAYHPSNRILNRSTATTAALQQSDCQVGKPFASIQSAFLF